MNRRQIAFSVAAAIVVAALLVPARASAQGVSYGAKGGLNVSTVTFNLSGVSPHISSRYGFDLGGFVAMDKGKAGLAIEILYSQKGAKLDFSQQGSIDTIDVKGDYIEIPVFGRMNLKSSDTSIVHPYVGPVFGFKVSDEIVETQRVNNVTTTTTQHDQIKGSDVGIAIGVQFDMSKFIIDLRYNWGLMNVNKNSGTDEPEVKNRTFSLNFGWTIGKKK
ncbi:MAG TPA: porin family protein [Vicinamibacterales bacterium]|nr:porin family protein [Vicinamibacterales bacterium]